MKKQWTVNNKGQFHHLIKKMKVDFPLDKVFKIQAILTKSYLILDLLDPQQND